MSAIAALRTLAKDALAVRFGHEVASDECQVSRLADVEGLTALNRSLTNVGSWPNAGVAPRSAYVRSNAGLRFIDAQGARSIYQLGNRRCTGRGR